MDDVKKIFSHSLSSRIKHPLLSSFTIAWLILNYRFIIIVMMSPNLRDATAGIDYYWDDSSIFSLHGGWYRGLLLPLLSSIIYLLIQPKIGQLLNKYYFEKMISVENERKGIEGKLLPNIDDHRKLTDENNKLHDELAQIKTDLLNQKKLVQTSDGESVEERRKIANLERDIKGHLEDIRNLTNENDLLLKDIEINKIRLDLLEQQNKDYSSDINDLKREEVKYQEEIRTIKSDLDSAIVQLKVIQSELGDAYMLVDKMREEYRDLLGSYKEIIEDSKIYTEKRKEYLNDNND